MNQAHFHRLLRFLAGLAEVAVLIGCFCVFVSLFGHYNFWADLVSHFRFQTISGLLVCGLGLFLVKRRIWGGVSLGVSVVLLLFLIPWFVGKDQPLEKATQRLLVFNVLTDNEEKGEVVEYIREQQPDIFILLEVNPDWIRAVSGSLASTYPHFVENARLDNFGIAAYSKRPLSRMEITFLGDEDIPSIDLLVECPDGAFRVIGTHPLPPVTPLAWHSRNKQMKSIAETAKSGHRPVLVCGDFNCTPWSPFYRSLIETGGLKNTACGFGLKPTWMARDSFLFALPLDHVFASEKVVITNHIVGPALGSDHRPITIDFQIVN